MISGSTGCGKSFLVSQILSRLNDAFANPPKRVLYCYSRDQDLYREMEKSCPVPITFNEGLPDSFENVPRRTLCIIDDLQSSGSEMGRKIVDVFIKHSHHSDMDVLYLVQNLFANTSHHRTCNLNSHYLVVFKNPRDKQQITCLARQIFPGNHPFLMECYKRATAKPHGYLFLDLKQGTDDDLRVRDSIFAEEASFFVDEGVYKNARKYELPLAL